MIPNPEAQRILCYGDSNTWGQNPVVKGGRFAPHQRWTGVLQQKLGEAYAIIEEGLSSRTTNLEYNKKPGRNGKTYFAPCLASQNPLDAVLIMLGTNDLKIEFSRPVPEIVNALAGYIDDIRQYAKSSAGELPRIALISPVHINPQAPHFAEFYAGSYDERSVQASHAFATAISDLADKRGVFFFDAAAAAAPGVDGIHISLGGHQVLGDTLAPKIIDWLQ